MTDEELRIWAIGQVIAHHNGNGVVTETLIAEADKLIAYVQPKRRAPADEPKA
jgi:hypothetical protein